MWLYLMFIILLLVGVVGTIASGGIFTIVLIPIAVIGLVSMVVSRGIGQAAEGGWRSGPRRSRAADPSAPLPSSQPSAPARVPTSPEGLTDARRIQQ
jgi:hypothetical protein